MFYAVFQGVRIAGIRKFDAGKMGPCFFVLSPCGLADFHL
jgi:hypothetical protein